MTLKKKLWIGGGALAVVALVVVVIAQRARGDKGTPVTFGAVKTGSIVGKVSGPGEINPEAIVDISAHLPGKITRLLVREGDPVTKGQALLELDPTQYAARVSEARANVAAQKSQVELAQAQSEKAGLVLKRTQDLHTRGLSSDHELDLARTDGRVEDARLQASEQHYEQALANLVAAQDDLDKCKYTSPMDGIVSRLNVEEGEIAVTGTMNNPGTVLLSIADLSRMEVEAEIDETDVVDVVLGQDVNVKVDAFPDTSFSATVTEIANTAVTRNKGTQEEVTIFTIKAVLAERVPQLRPGMTATVEIEIATRENVVRVPIQAIVSRSDEKEKKAFDRNTAKKPSGNIAEAAEGSDAAADEDDDERDRRIEGVYVMRDSRAVFVPVATGISDDRFIEAESGIAAGDTVVTGPYQTLRTLESGERIKEKKSAEGESEKKGA
jgi:HlyD family secretion protein